MDLDIKKINGYVWQALQDHKDGISAWKIKKYVEKRNLYPITNVASKIGTVLRAYKNNGLVVTVNNKYVLTQLDTKKFKWPLTSSKPMAERKNPSRYRINSPDTEKRRHENSSDDDESLESHQKRKKIKTNLEKRKILQKNTDKDEMRDSTNLNKSGKTAECENTPESNDDEMFDAIKSVLYT